MFGFLKGKIEINLEKYNFSPGDTINGTLLMFLKKPFQGREVRIELIAQRKEQQGKYTQIVRIFEFKQPLAGEKMYYTGPQQFKFEIKVPDIGNKIPRDTTFGKIFGFFSRPVQWYLIGTFNVPGFDITKKVQINVA